MAEIKKDNIFYDQSGGGVTFSGGEPLLQPLFLKSLLSCCRRENIHTIVDTSGYVPFDDWAMVIDDTDEWYYDLKLIDNIEHRKYTGVSNKLILENLVRLNHYKASIVIRIPLIPGITDTEKNLTGLCEYLGSHKILKPVSLLPYNKFGENKRLRFGMDDRLGGRSMQSKEELRMMIEIFRRNGFRVKTGG
jgi:pyruvate formate lyase activating enzyme